MANFTCDTFKRDVRIHRVLMTEVLAYLDQLRCTYRINKENIRVKELPASLVLSNPLTGQSVADKDLLSNLLCACLHVSAYTCA